MEIVPLLLESSDVQTSRPYARPSDRPKSAEFYIWCKASGMSISSLRIPQE
jgi:hypothetical protein